MEFPTSKTNETTSLWISSTKKFLCVTYLLTIHVILGVGGGIILANYYLPQITFPSLDERLVLSSAN